MSSGDQRERGKLFNEVPALYERVRPSYPDELFTDLVAVTGVDATSSILEIGCGTPGRRRDHSPNSGAT